MKYSLFALLAIGLLFNTAEARNPDLIHHFEPGEFRQTYCFNGKRFNTRTRAGVSKQAFTDFYCRFMEAQETTDPIRAQQLFNEILELVHPNISWDDNLEIVEPAAALHAHFSGRDKFIEWASAIPNGASQEDWDVRVLFVDSRFEKDDTARALSDESVGVHAICDNEKTQIGFYDTKALMNWTVSPLGNITHFEGYYHKLDDIIRLFRARYAFVKAEEKAGKTCDSIL